MGAYTIIIDHLKKKHNLHADWDVYEYESIHDDPVPGESMVVHGTKFTGAVPGKYVRGPKKGKQNWSKMDKNTVRSFFLSSSDMQSIYLYYEASTGNCSKCEGNGKECYGYSTAEGNKYRDCKECGGTGKAKKLCAKSDTQ